MKQQDGFSKYAIDICTRTLALVRIAWISVSAPIPETVRYLPSASNSHVPLHYRVLKPGGRFVVSDVVSESTIPLEMRDYAELFSSCVSGASQVDQYFDIIKKSGFTNIEELDRKSYGNLDQDGKRIEMFSITVRGYK